MTLDPGRPQTLTVHVPMKFEVRGGRKRVISEITAPPADTRTNNALLKALAKAHRWRQQIENGEYASITELAKAERVNESYACRLLRLTLLAPSLVTAMLDGQHGPDLTLKDLTKPLPTHWAEQLMALKIAKRGS